MSQIIQKIHGDRVIWVIAFFMAIASVLVVYSATATLAYKYHDGNSIYYLVKHSFFIVAGFFIMYFIHNLKYTYLSKISVLAFYAGIILLILTLLFGANVNNASRWLTIPFINQRFQTSDFAKIALIMYLARTISMKQNIIHDFKKGFLPIVIPVIITCLLILPANFSTALLVFTVSAAMMFVGRVKILHIASVIGAGIVLFGLVLLIGVSFPKVFPRAQTWVNRIENFNKEDAKGNYQVEHSKIAIATGKITGKGPGKSTERSILPHPYSDFVYAIVVEEYGLIGGVFVLLLYIILFIRAIKITINTQKTFGSLLVFGLSFLLVFQAFVNMAVATNLIPVTGQPLPLISMGGTSIWFTFVALGIILSVSREKEYLKPSAA
jgi:cell division protein FtsW